MVMGNLNLNKKNVDVEGRQSLGSGMATLNKKIAVHLHIYYEDKWGEIAAYLANLQSYDYDLFVTLIKPNEELEKNIKKFKPEAQVFVIDNRGYDIGAFVWFLHQINLADYDYILKIHTKNTTRDTLTHINCFYLKNSEWSKLLWDGVLKDEGRVKQVMELLADEATGMVGSWYLVTKTLKENAKVKEGCLKVMKQLGLTKSGQPYFVPGTMFWVKSALMTPIKANVTQQDFEVSGASGSDGSFAHIMERILGYVVAENYNIKGVGFEVWTAFVLSIRPFLRFCFQKKITHNGKLIIKVFKLPIFSKLIRSKGK